MPSTVVPPVGTGLDASPYLAYVPQLVRAWPTPVTTPSVVTHEGSMVFVDISGFTAMSERLARYGRVGAEEVTDVIGSCFASLLAVAYGEDGGLLKFGGDALLLFFPGEDHAARAVRSAARMRRTLREIGAIRTTAGLVRLKMSVGVHTGAFTFFLVGDRHRELVVTGPAASRTVQMEGTAEGGQIVLSPATAGAIPARNRGAPTGDGVLLRGTPPGRPPVIQLDAPTVDQPHRYVSSAIHRHLEGGDTTSIHRVVTVAFVHFSGTDALLDREGPHAVAGALHELVSTAQRAADEQGVTFIGTDVDVDGGKIILVSGAPTIDADDAGRMLHAVRTVVAIDTPLHLQIGVNRGHVFAGSIGPPYRRTYTVMGDAVNLAARVMAKAEHGQVLATTAVLDAAAAAFDTAPLDPFRVKGKSEPVQAHVVGEPREQEARGRRSDEAPFVGRVHELAAVQAARAAAAAGTGRVVEVVGAAGIGKSRLLERCLEDERHVSWVGCHAFEASIPYRAGRRLLRGVLAEDAGAGEFDLTARLCEIVDDRAPDLVAWLPLIGDVLGVELPSTVEADSLEDRFRPERTVAVVADLLDVLWRDGRIVVVEDLQWIDAASHRLVRELVVRAAARPWLLCVTRRPDGDPAELPELPHVARLEVGPLSGPDARVLLRWLTRESPPLPHLADAVVRRAGGNPLFLVELVGALGRVQDGELPASLESAVEASIDRLDPLPRQRLREAAVLGPRFPRPTAVAVFPDLLSLLPRLAGYLDEDGDDHLRFSSSLAHDAAYGELPYRRRRELHAEVADVVASAAGDEPAPAVAAELSRHLLAAESWSEAWVHARRAADHARSLYANAEADELYQRAATAGRRAGVAAAELSQALLWMGEARIALGDFEGAARAFDRARASADDPVVEARIMRRQSFVPYRAGKLPVALRYVTRALRLLDGVESVEADAERARLAARYASIRLQQGQYADVERWALRAIEAARASRTRDALAHAFNLIDQGYVWSGVPDRATYSLSALALYEELGDVAGQAAVLNNLGVIAYWRGDWDLAVEYYRRGQDAQERSGDLLSGYFGNLNVGEVLSDTGRFDEAAAALEDALLVCRSANLTGGAGIVLRTRGRLRARTGEAAAARADFAAAQRAFDEVGAKGESELNDAYRLEAMVLAGDADQGLEEIRRAIADLGPNATGLQVPVLLRLEGTALDLLDRPVDALHALAVAVDVARQRRLPYDVALALRERARVLTRLGDEPEAAAAAAEADGVFARLGVVDARTRPADVVGPGPRA